MSSDYSGYIFVGPPASGKGTQAFVLFGGVVRYRAVSCLVLFRVEEVWKPFMF